MLSKRRLDTIWRARSKSRSLPAPGAFRIPEKGSANARYCKRVPASSECRREVAWSADVSVNVHGEGRAPLLRASLSNVLLGFMDTNGHITVPSTIPAASPTGPRNEGQWTISRFIYCRPTNDVHESAAHADDDRPFQNLHIVLKGGPPMLTARGSNNREDHERRCCRQRGREDHEAQRVQSVHET